MDGIEKILEKIDEDFFVIKQSEIEKIEPDIPDAPSKELVIELLAELPSQIEFLSNRAIQCKKYIGDLKLLIKSKKNFLEREKSRIRQDILNLHKKELEEYYKTMKEIFKDVIESSSKVAKGTLQEMVKTMRPEKPAKGELDDKANVLTAEIQDEIIAYEEQLNKLEELYDLLKARVEKYENKFIAVRALKGIMVEELRNQI